MATGFSGTVRTRRSVSRRYWKRVIDAARFPALLHEDANDGKRAEGGRQPSVVSRQSSVARRRKETRCQGLHAATIAAIVRGMGTLDLSTFPRPTFGQVAKWTAARAAVVAVTLAVAEL